MRKETRPTRPGQLHCDRLVRAFSLLEVLIALGIFFMAMFTILGMVSSSLRSARNLRRLQVDAGMVAAQLLIQTNRFNEGTVSGDFGQLYQDYTFSYDCTMVETNGLMQFDIKVFHRGTGQPVDTASILLFSPESAALTLGGPRFR